MTSPPRASFTAVLPPPVNAGRAELLGRFVPTAIRRPPKSARIQNPFRVVLVGLVSAGFIPAYWLVQRVGRTIALQSEQIELSTELLEASGKARGDEAEVLRAASKAVSPARTLVRAAGWALVVAVVAAGLSIGGAGGGIGGLRRLWFAASSLDDAYVLTSLISLSASYLLAIAAINRHTVSLQQYAMAFNAAVVTPPAEPIDGPSLVWGLRPVHVVLGLVLAAFGMLWGLPMMLAWAAFQSMCYDTTQTFRISLADRLQAISGAAPVADLTDHCVDPQCRAPIPFQAKFCPRCGKAVFA